MQRRAFCASTLSLTAAAFVPWRRVLGAEGDVPAVSPAGQQIVLGARAIEDFRAGLRGELLLQGQAGYDQVRRIWNGAFATVTPR